MHACDVYVSEAACLKSLAMDSVCGTLTSWICMRSLEGYSGLINSAARQLVATLRPAARDGSLVDMTVAVTETILQIIGTSAFG